MPAITKADPATLFIADRDALGAMESRKTGIHKRKIKEINLPK